MAEEATATTETATPAVPAEGAAPVPANDAVPAGVPAAANDNAQPAAPTEAEVIALAEKYGPEKALQILARKLNYAVDGTSVTVEDRKKFRDENRAAKRALEERGRQIEEQLSGRVKESQAEIELGRAIRAAHETGDYDGVARALGLKDWNQIEEQYISKLADPNHKRLTDLEAKLRDKEAAEEQARREGETRAQQQQRMQAVYQYKVKMSGEMKASELPILSAMASNPDVVNMVYAIRDEHYKTHEVEMPLAQVLVSKLPGSDVTLKTLLRAWHDQLSAAFKAETGAAPAVPPPAPAKGKTAPAPTPAPSTSRSYADSREWVKSAQQRMEQAFKADAEKEAEETRRGNSAQSA